MSKRTLTITAIALGLVVIVFVGTRMGQVEGQQVSGSEELPGAGFAAIPGLEGGQDIWGPYEPVVNWPRPMSESLPGHENWTYSVTMDVFAESPDRILVASQGELPLLNRREIETTPLPHGPGLVFPINRLPLRQAGFLTATGENHHDLALCQLPKGEATQPAEWDLYPSRPVA